MKRYANPEGCHICHVGGRTYDMIFLGSKDLGKISDGTAKCPTETAEKNKWILKGEKLCSENCGQEG